MHLEPTPRQLERFWSKVRMRDDHWYWTGELNKKGYGKFMLRKGRMIAAHRFVLLSVGVDIPLTSDVHHLCGVKCCVDPRHLEVIDHAEHARLHQEADTNPASSVSVA
ncbi:MAG: HNH endonuclease [Ilumatobacteraceae bacterium]